MGSLTGNPNGLRHGRWFDNLQQPIWRWLQRLPWTESPILQLLVLRLLLMMPLQLLLLLLLLLLLSFDTDTTYLLPMLLQRLPCIGVHAAWQLAVAAVPAAVQLAGAAASPASDVQAPVVRCRRLLRAVSYLTLNSGQQP